jgi:arginine deiminase
MVPENLERYRPGPGGVAVPNPDYLLFEDLVLLSELQAEHAAFTSVLRAVTGEEGQVDFRWLLASALSVADARQEAIDGALELERRLYGTDEAARNEARGVLERLDATRLAEALVTGREPQGLRRLLRWPIPNTLFTRDLAAVVGDAFVLTYAAEPARRRDMLLMRVVLRHHPLLKDVPRIDVAEDGPIREEGREPATIEGGDVQVVSERIVLVGVGMRTTMTAVRRLAPRLFARGVEAVLACEMPRRRAAMHIDTLFTRIDEGTCLVWPPLLEAHARGATAGDQPPTALRLLTPDGERPVEGDLLRALASLGLPLEPVLGGGRDPVTQAREQWSDGANAFALAPGVIVSYGRNEATLRELNDAGYEIVTPERFVRNARLYVRGSPRKVVVALTGHELVRGRGGPRCLTLPLRRGPLPPA